MGSYKYTCGDCDTSTVLIAGCGVSHDLYCECGNSMYHDGTVETEYVGHKHEYDQTHKICDTE